MCFINMISKRIGFEVCNSKFVIRFFVYIDLDPTELLNKFYSSDTSTLKIHNKKYFHCCLEKSNFVNENYLMYCLLIKTSKGCTSLHVLSLK